MLKHIITAQILLFLEIPKARPHVIKKANKVSTWDLLVAIRPKIASIRVAIHALVIALLAFSIFMRFHIIQTVFRLVRSVFWSQCYSRSIDLSIFHLTNK